MATADKPRSRPASSGRAHDRQMYHPLDRLRGIIYRYVLIEALLSAFLFLTVWFTLGLVFDFVLFKVTGWDWALDTGRGIRILALVTATSLFVGVMGYRLLGRLTKEFSYPALALVLERRFPKLLGDRLITAVEMADVESMAKFGYSREMIEATIVEARERVGKVPVSKVFNWKRLWVMGLVSFGLMFLTVAVAFASHVVALRSVEPVRFGWKFAHVSGIFVERNVALQNTPWPRRAHVELVGFPESGEATVSQSVATVPITARAYKWVVADRGAPEGWRPMRWSDVKQDLVGRPVPEFDFQALRAPDEAVGSMPGTADEWTVDAVERRVNAAEGAGESHPSAALGDTMGDIRAVLAALNTQADKPSMGRTLRKLELTRKVVKVDEEGKLFEAEEPIEVSFKYYGAKYRGNGTLKAKQNNEFEGDVSGLKEDVNFVVRTEDFATRPLRIRLIPPPTLKRLYRIQEEPAYLHHAPAQGESFAELKGRRQLMAEKNLSLTGDRSIFVVPAGTQLKITADAYTDDAGNLSDNDAVVTAFATPEKGKFPDASYGDDGKMTQAPVPVTLLPDGKGFSFTFRHLWEDYTRDVFDGEGKGREVLEATAGLIRGIRDAVDFRLKGQVEFKVTWTNRYNVSTTRSILIQVAPDQPPVVEVGVDVIRKVGNTYLVTPMAKIPLNPDSFVRDDHGLSNVEFDSEFWAEDSDVIRAIRAGLVTRAFLSAPHAGPLNPNAVILPQYHAQRFRDLDTNSARERRRPGVAEFDNQATRLRRDTRERLMSLLGNPSGDDTNPEGVRRLDLKNPDRDFFDLDAKYPDGHPKAGQRVFPILAPSGEVQPTYRMDIFVQATDNNADADGGPRMTRSAEPIRLRIVSEGDLLQEISKEEVQLGERLGEALVRLAAAKKKYEFVRSNNGYKDETPENVDAVKVRHQDALQDVDKSRDIVATVLREFRRIHRECQVNRVIEITTKNYLSYCTDLEAILSEDPNVEVTYPKTLGLLNNVQNTLNGGRWAPGAIATDAEQSIYKLELALREIRKRTEEGGNQQALIKRLREQIQRQEKIRAEIDALYQEWVRGVNSPTPKIAPLETAVVINKNESKKVQHLINWRQYKEDDLVVKLKSSDPAVVVPAELTLNFEKHQFRFDYEVKAGAAAGTYTITLTPASGAPVEVLVTVK